MKISVVGLDYADLPLAIQFARANVPVLGLDVDAVKVDLINQGYSYIRHIPQATIEEIAKDNRLSASTDFSRIREVEAVIICVPTPLNKNREPDYNIARRMVLLRTCLGLRWQRALGGEKNSNQIESCCWSKTKADGCSENGIRPGAFN